MQWGLAKMMGVPFDSFCLKLKKDCTPFIVFLSTFHLTSYSHTCLPKIPLWTTLPPLSFSFNKSSIMFLANQRLHLTFYFLLSLYIYQTPLKKNLNLKQHYVVLCFPHLRHLITPLKKI